MNKRLRRKKRVGEFKEPGFEVRGELRPGMARAELDAFVDRLLAQVEVRQLGFGGGIGDTIDGFVTRDGRASATDDDRAAVSAFLDGDVDVRHEIGVLRDAWR